MRAAPIHTARSASSWPWVPAPGHWCCFPHSLPWKQLGEKPAKLDCQRHGQQEVLKHLLQEPQASPAHSPRQRWVAPRGCPLEGHRALAELQAQISCCQARRAGPAVRAPMRLQMHWHRFRMASPESLAAQMRLLHLLHCWLASVQIVAAMRWRMQEESWRMAELELKKQQGQLPGLVTTLAVSNAWLRHLDPAGLLRTLEPQPQTPAPAWTQAWDPIAVHTSQPPPCAGSRQPGDPSQHRRARRIWRCTSSGSLGALLAAGKREWPLCCAGTQSVGARWFQVLWHHCCLHSQVVASPAMKVEVAELLSADIREPLADGASALHSPVRCMCACLQQA
mmetsp:Transcript_58334/g.139056  ORF Transcript_58334/g.139056 Transcript_58334/m.139056 type:complete len:337 (-) Transcript_58334:1069-2079(-)